MCVCVSLWGGAHRARSWVGHAASELHPAVVWTFLVGKGAVEGSSDGAHGVDTDGGAGEHGAVGQTAAGEAGPPGQALFGTPQLNVEELPFPVLVLCSPSS